jgi:hypothetical protein
MKPTLLSAAIQQSILFDLLTVRAGIALTIPDGGDTLFDLFVGFPIKYRFSDKIAILALDRLITFHTCDSCKPDLDIGIGGIFQALDALAIIVRATVHVGAFDSNLVFIPLELDIQYSPSNRIDFGLSLTLNINPNAPDGASPLDSRAGGLFIRARF